MQIIVEDTEVNLDLPDRAVTLEEVLDEVEEFLLSSGWVPVALNVNGHEFTQEDLEKRKSTQLEGNERLKFSPSYSLDGQRFD